MAFRRSFGELKTATERDMSHLRADVTKASRSLNSACLNLSANQRSSDTQLSVLLDREKQERMSLESQLRDKNREIAELQSRYDTHSAELNSKYAFWNRSNFRIPIFFSILLLMLVLLNYFDLFTLKHSFYHPSVLSRVLDHNSYFF